MGNRLSKKEFSNVRIDENIKDFYENAPDLFVSVDAITGKILQCNETFVRSLGYAKHEVLGKSVTFVYHPDCEKDRMKVFQAFVSRGVVNDIELQLRKKDGSKLDVSLSLTAVRNGKGEVLHSRSIWRDITERKKTEQLLEESKSALEKKNIALNEVIGQVEIEKQNIRENVTENVDKVLLPILKRLKLKGESKKYVRLLESHLKDLVSSYGKMISLKKYKLAPRELEICNMIKEGLTSKEIARLLSISSMTVDTHRKMIRKKMGISNKSTNLTSFLKSS